MFVSSSQKTHVFFGFSNLSIFGVSLASRIFVIVDYSVAQFSPQNNKKQAVNFSASLFFA